MTLWDREVKVRHLVLRHPAILILSGSSRNVASVGLPGCLRRKINLTIILPFPNHVPQDT